MSVDAFDFKKLEFWKLVNERQEVPLQGRLFIPLR